MTDRLTWRLAGWAVLLGVGIVAVVTLFAVCVSLAVQHPRLSIYVACGCVLLAACVTAWRQVTAADKREAQARAEYRKSANTLLALQAKRRRMAR